MDEITIQQADFDDLDQQHAIIELLDMYARDPMGRDAPLEESARLRLIHGLRSHPCSLVLLAYAGDAPVGILTAFEGFSTFAARRLLNIHDVAVAPDHRGHGVGIKLLEAVETLARERGYCKLTLEVRQDNLPAQMLYRRFGFNADEAAMVFWTRPLS